MFTRHYLRQYPFAVFFNASTGAEGAGTGTESKPTSAAETPAEPTTLADAKAQLAAERQKAKDAAAKINAVEKERDDAKAEVTTITGQFNAATAEATTAKSNLATANATITTLTQERDTARADHTKAQENVTRLEALCGVKGIDPNAAVVAALQQTPGAGTRDELVANLNATTDPVARGKAAEALRAFDAKAKEKRK